MTKLEIHTCADTRCVNRVAKPGQYCNDPACKRRRGDVDEVLERLEKKPNTKDYQRKQKGKK
jgi:hypothetical protein